MRHRSILDRHGRTSSRTPKYRKPGLGTTCSSNIVGCPTYRMKVWNSTNLIRLRTCVTGGQAPLTEITILLRDDALGVSQLVASMTL
jgi:hypothetical protein